MFSRPRTTRSSSVGGRSFWRRWSLTTAEADIDRAALLEARRGVARARASRGWAGVLVEGCEARLLGALGTVGFLLALPVRLATPAEEALAEELLVAKAELRA